MKPSLLNFADRLRKTRASRVKSVSRVTAVRVLAMTVLAAWVLLAGTPLRPQEPSKKQDKLLTQESGFLGDDYSKLQPDPGNSDWLSYFKNPDVLKKSDTFVLDPVKVFLVPEAKQGDIDPADLAKLSDYFTKAVKDELQAVHYKLRSR